MKTALALLSDKKMIIDKYGLRYVYDSQQAASRHMPTLRNYIERRYRLKQNQLYKVRWTCTFVMQSQRLLSSSHRTHEGHLVHPCSSTVCSGQIA